MGLVLFDKKVQIECSRKTGRVRRIYSQDRLVATLRPKDGYLALALHAANVILSNVKHPPNLVTVESEVSDAIKAGGDVFAKHVVLANEDLRPGDEVIVTNEKGLLLGVGAAVLSGREMCAFKRGVAVKLRKGVNEAENDGSEA
jgi:7-cyano-7-deazaguanine tRNA-ribosyltransferase